MAAIRKAADSRRRLDGWRFRPNIEVPRSITSSYEGLIDGGIVLFDASVISTSALEFNRVLISYRVLIS